MVFVQDYVLRSLVGAVALMACQTADAENLSSAIGNALRNHPELHALQFESEAANYGISAAKGLNRPQISVKASATYATDLTRENTGWNAGVSATQRLYDGGYATSERHRASALANSVENQLIDKAMIVGLESIQAYMEVQRSRGLVRILTANVERLSALRGRIEARVIAGASTEVDLYETSAKIDASKIQLLDARTQLADAVVNYRTIIGKNPDKLDTISSPTMALPRNADRAVSLAVLRSPKIMAVKYEALAASSVADGYASARRPKLDLALEATESGNFSRDVNDNQDLSAQVVFRFDLYDGGTGKARYNQALSTARAAESRTKTASLEVEREIRLAWNNIHIAKDKAKTVRSQLTNSRRALTLGLKRYRAGVTSMAQLLDMHIELTTAEAAWLNAEFIHRYNVYRILAGTGRLMAVLHLNTPGSKPIQ